MVLLVEPKERISRQLVVKINFGPVESPEKTIPLIDLVDNLRVVLAALPFVSQASKQKAIDAMSTTHFDMELPVNVAGW